MKNKTKLNPYDLIRSVSIWYRGNKNIRLIMGTKTAVVCKDDDRFIMKKYFVNIPPCKYSKDEREILDYFIRIKRFCYSCMSKYEAMHLIISAYKNNPDVLKLKIDLLPVYSDESDEEYVKTMLF